MCVNTCKTRIDYLLIKKYFGGTEICPAKFSEESELQSAEIIPEIKDLIAEMLNNARIVNGAMTTVVEKCDVFSTLRNMIKEFITKYPNIRDRANCIKWVVASVGKPFNEQTNLFAASVELIHLAAILTDNIFDKTETCGEGSGGVDIKEPWKEYSPEEIYTLAEVLTCIAVDNIVKSFKSKRNFNQIISRVLKIIKANYVGEFMDIRLQKQRTATFSDYIEMAGRIEGKPLRFAIEGALYLVDADDECIRNLGELGEKLGTMFKIRNDIFDIDAESDKNAIGKEPGEDLNIENIFYSKKTLPIIYLLQNSNFRNGEEKEFKIDTNIYKITIQDDLKIVDKQNDQEITNQEHKKEILRQFITQNYLSLCKANLNQYYSQAFDKIHPLPPSEGKSWLEKFISFVAHSFSLSVSKR